MPRHGEAHLVRRQRNHENHNNGVATVVSVVFKTLPNTYTEPVVWVTQAPQTLIGNPVQISTSAQAKQSQAQSNDASEKPSATKQSSHAKETASSSPAHSATTLMVATSSPLASSASAAIAAATASDSSSPSATAEAAKSTGMSGGAKAGLALGILLGIAALLGFVLLMYHRKKKNMAQQKLEDEKSAMYNAPPPPIVEPAQSIRSQRTLSTAPRLSLRPVTQFSPQYPESRKSGGNLLNVAAAGAVAAPRQSHEQAPSPTSSQPGSAWERRGAANAANAPTNPFSDPQPEQRPASPPQNPFSNQAAIESPQATPQTASYGPNGNMNDFANPGPAIAAAEALPPNAAPVAMAAVPVARRAVPTPQPGPPPSIRSMDSNVPPSPAWTEDIPASPGPAPTGPPPVAVAGASPHGPAAAPNNVHRVQLEFKPSMADELELRPGQLVRMLHEYDDGWALCIRMDRSQQGVVPRTCLSKHPVKPRNGPPRQQGPPRQRGPPMGPPMGPGAPQPRPLSPAGGRNSPVPPNGRMSPPGMRSMSPGPRPMSPNMGPPGGRGRSNSNAPYAGPPRSMSPGPYGGGPQDQMSPPKMGRPRSNSASQVMARRVSPPGPSPMNPNANAPLAMPSRKPLPGQAL